MQCQLKGKNDTLVKDGDPQKPHPIWLAHIEESLPPSPPPPLLQQHTSYPHIFAFSSTFALNLHILHTNQMNVKSWVK